MINLKIRQVRETDLDRCYHIETMCFPPAESASRTNMKRRIEIFPEGFLVALVDEIIVGHINSGATNKEDITAEGFKGLVGHQDDGAHVVVFSLAVLPEYRGQGIATRLMRVFVARAREAGRKQVILMCKSNLIGYYEALGFLYIKRSNSNHGGATWHEMVYPLGL